MLRRTSTLNPNFLILRKEEGIGISKSVSHLEFDITNHNKKLRNKEWRQRTKFVCREFVDLVSLNVCQHCSCTSVHILCIPANVVTSALAQVFSRTVIHGIESQHSFNLVAERWLASNKPMRLLPRCGSWRRSKIS